MSGCSTVAAPLPYLSGAARLPDMEPANTQEPPVHVGGGQGQQMGLRHQCS